MKFDFNIKNKKSGFTLIELLVVVAIIGILASVVLVSLNSARDKGKIAAIKSNLKNMGAQMELSYLDNGNYGGINSGGSFLYPDTTCIGPIANMAQSIINGGAKVRCLSVNYSGWSDLSQRWGASGLIYSTTAPVKAWSVSGAGVVAWDAQGVNSLGAFVTPDVTMTWDTAVAACATAGGRLPTIEELKTLADAQCIAQGTPNCNVEASRTPPGFQASYYHSGTTVPSNSANAYRVPLSHGFMEDVAKTATNYVRCVR